MGMISPSMMCADFANLSECVKKLEQENIEYLHIDVMDGDFVPNFTLGPDFINALRKITDIPMDIHLMINNPERHIDTFKLREGDIVAVHYEATKHLQKALKQIADKGAIPAVAINPATPINVLDYVLDDIGMVLVMTVNPGFAGQKLVPQTLQKITEVKEYLKRNGKENVLIEVDGNVSFENALKMRKAGADIFVAGTSSIFTDKLDFTEAVKTLRNAIE